ncbi:MAG: LEA type 2 family protein [Cyclobacteriaceae bacterium]|nr:LEA type 2 family protein [Cyclobacteriaceae bacterium]
MKRILVAFLLAVAFQACTPKEPVVLREVHIRSVELGRDGKGPLLKADAILYNPNKGSLRLKEIDLDILLNEKPAATIDQELNAQIKGQSEFTVPLEVQLTLSDSGLLDTVLSLFGGKKYSIRFTGKIKVKVGGFPVKIPVDHRDEIRF